MPWHWKEAIRLDLQKAQGSTANNLEDLVANYYGRTIYDIFYKNYFQKMFNSDASEIQDIGWFQKLLKPIEDKVSYHPEKTYFPVDHGYNKVFKYLTEGIEIHLNRKISAADIPVNDIAICTGRVDYFLNKVEELPYIKFSFDVDSAQYASTKPDTVIFPNHTPFMSITQFGKFFPNYPKNIIVKDSTDGEEEVIPPLKLNPKTIIPNLYFAGRQGSCKMFDMSDCIKQASQLAGQIKHKERTR
jgi:UDP-galactopyranose mutase